MSGLAETLWVVDLNGVYHCGECGHVVDGCDTEVVNVDKSESLGSIGIFTKITNRACGHSFLRGGYWSLRL